MSNKLKKIEISAFRAFNKKQIFDFTCDDKIANLVVIFGPNGFGKTSFLDAVEWGLTGKINRIVNNKILKEKANSENGYVLKNTNSEVAVGEVVFIADNDDKMIRTTQELNGKCKRDYKVGNKKFIGETFKEIYKENVNNNNILAHDQIDSFLKSVTPEERYNGLVSFWDYTNDAEEYQKILEVYKIGQDYIKENKKELSNKKKELKQVESEIYSLEKLNVDLMKVNEKLNGEKIKLLNEAFTKDDLNNIKEFLLAYISRIEDDINNINYENERIKYLYNNYEEYKLNCTQYKEKNEIIKDIKEKLNVYKEYKDKISEKSVKDKILKDLEYQNKTIKFLIENIDEFESEINKIKQLKDDIRNIEKKLNQLDGAFLEVNNKIETNNINRDKLVKAIHLYKSKISNSKQLMEYDSRLRTLKTTKNDFYRELEALRRNIINLEANNKEKEKIIENISKMNTENKLNSIPNGYENYYNDIKNSFELYDFIKEKIRTNNEQFNTLIDLKNEAKELVTAGLKHIENTETSICPLCNKEFDNHKSLLNAINTKISNAAVIKKLKDENEELNKREKELRLNISNKKEEIIKAIRVDIKSRNDKVYTIKLKIKELEVEIVNLENEMKLLNGEIEITSVYFEEDEILALNEKDMFETMQLKWKKILNEKESNLDEINKLIKNDEKEKEDFTKSINGLKKNIQCKLGKIREIESREFIETFMIRLKENNIDKKEEIVNVSNEITSKLNFIADEEKKLNNEIIVLIEKIKNSDEKNIKNQLEIESKNIEKLSKKINTYSNFLKYIKEVEMQNFNKNMLYTIIKEKEIKIEENQKIKQFLRATLENVILLNNNIRFNRLRNELKEKEIYIKYLDEMNERIEKIKLEATEYIEKKINRAFNTDVINAIYDMIEPHPELKEIKIVPNFDSNKPQLNIYSLNKNGNKHEPALYLSSAQLNILSLSIFLARTLHEKSENMNTIFMDDTVEHLDSINTLSFIDLIRNIISVLDIQIVLTTHNEDLFNLFKRKIDSEYYNAKYLELNGFGVLKGEEG